MAEHHFQLFADYFQFYLQDGEADGDLSASWTDEAVQCLLALAPGTIGVGTVRDTDVPVTVEVRDEAPVESDYSPWDQINEGSIEVPSGRLVVAGCTDYFPDAARVLITPGTYRARIYYGQLDSLREDGLEGDDHYRVVLWPAPTSPRRLLKSRCSPTS